MPFRSEKQRRYMYAKHPEIAKRWTKEYGSKVAPKAGERSAGSHRPSTGRGASTGRGSKKR